MARAGWTEIAAYDVPQGHIFFFDRFGVDYQAGTAAVAGDMHFGVLVNAEPLGEGFGDFTHLMGALNYADMCVVQQRILGPATVSIEARIPDGETNHDAYGRIYGFLGPDK